METEKKMIVFQGLNIKQFNELLICEKPHGISTEKKNNLIGYVDWIEEKIKKKLYTFEKLDLNTSGVTIFTESPEKIKELSELSKKKTIQQKYLFITDKKINKHKIAYESFDNTTQFEQLKIHNQFTLWQATTWEASSDQIRSYAHKIGIPILGDTEYDGNAFFRLCLHRTGLKIAELDEFKSQPPKYFEELALVENTFRCKLEEAIHRRQMVYNLNSSKSYKSCLRLLHNEIPLLKIDLFGEIWWIYDYGITQEEKEDLFVFLKTQGNPPFYIREMTNRGQTEVTGAFDNRNSPLPQWLANENNMTFQFRSQQGLSPGLFLDQRENRNWVLKNAMEKTVLNLFSYTGGFSVASSLGKAKSVTTVDLSKSFIEWSKINFKLNNLDIMNYEFWVADSRTYIEGCIKRKKTFDLIICDPPSFSRGKNALFRIDKDVSNLIQSLWSILAKGGHLLFCTNFEKWDLKQLKENIKLLSNNTVDLQILTPPLLGLDFELPNKNPILKTLLIQKNS
jgi:23S rRNA (cytosine1962-C5)-methyltransferase